MSITELANPPPVSLRPKPMASRGVMYAGMLLGSVALMLTVGALHDSAYGEGGRPVMPVSAGQGRSAPEAVRPVAASAAPAVSAGSRSRAGRGQQPVAERAPVVAEAPVERVAVAAQARSRCEPRSWRKPRSRWQHRPR